MLWYPSRNSPLKTPSMSRVKPSRLLLALLSGLLLSGPAAARAPNVIVIFVDDQGYNDLGCFGSETIRTPEIDALAAAGRRFTNFHVASSVCSPSRAGLLTGSYPKRVGMHRGVLFPTSDHGLHPEEVTIADHLKSKGYATACIGKWHLGHHPEVLPRAQGFDSYFGIPYSNDMNHPRNENKPKASSDEMWLNQDKFVKFWKTPLLRDEEIIELPVNQRTITRRYTDEAIQFISANKDRPFFLYLAHSMPHIPLFVPDDAFDPDPANAYKAVIEHIDTETGRLIKQLRTQGLAENTIVVYTSDNGPWLQFKNHGGSAKPLRAGKATTFEGGQRVPFIIWAPGRVPAGTTSSELASALDLFPSLAAMAGHPYTPKERAIDGLDLSATFTGSAPSVRSEFLYYSRGGALEGIRQGDWKLLIKSAENTPKAKSSVMLFKLTEDIGEKNNLASQQPQKVATLRERMHQLDAEIEQSARPVWRKN